MLLLGGNVTIGTYLSLLSCIVFNRGQALVSSTLGLLIIDNPPHQKSILQEMGGL